MRLPPRWVLFLIVMIEGFAVLASEILAIRQIIPYAGSGTDTVAIIIAAVLLPLAIGNYNGGRFQPNPSGPFYNRSVRTKLIFNALAAMAFLTAGLSYPVMDAFFSTLFSADIDNRHIVSTAYAVFFLVAPVYLLGQTLPLVGHYFSRENVQQATGKILFASTTGSFLGSVFCTLVLMAVIGVHYTVVVVISSLAVLLFALSKKSAPAPVFAGLAVVVAALTLNNDLVMQRNHIVANNEYHMIQIVPDKVRKDTRTMFLNGSNSARYSSSDENYFLYVSYINRTFFDTLKAYTGEPKEILVVGAGGFVMGVNDRYNRITYIDIDDSLKEISEQLLLKKKLSSNKTFVPTPARAFLIRNAQQHAKKYDLIILDTYTGDITFPEHLITRDFFQQVYDALKDDGIMVANIISSPTFSDTLTVRLDNTLQSVFGNLNRQIPIMYDPWNHDPALYRNAIYSAYKRPQAPDDSYADSRNPSFYDRFRAVQ